MLRNVASGLRSLFRTRQVDQDLDEEVRANLEMAVEEKMKCGMGRAEAVRAVRLEQGDLDVTREMVRSSGWESVLDSCWQDVRFGVRMLGKDSVFTSIAVLTLAAAIGANTSVFSIVDAVLLRALTYENAERLVAVWCSEIGQPGTKL